MGVNLNDGIRYLLYKGMGGIMVGRLKPDWRGKKDGMGENSINSELLLEGLEQKESLG